MDSLFKAIKIEDGFIAFMNYKKQVFIQMIKPVPVEKFVEKIMAYSRKGYVYLYTGTFQHFFAECCLQFQKRNKISWDEE